MTRLSVLFLAATLAVAAEPSAFRAGDMSLDEPYGLTPTEQQIHQNRQAITRLDRRLFALEQQGDELTTLIGGLHELVRGNGESVRRLERQMAELQSALGHAQGAEERQGQELEHLKGEIDQALSIHGANHQKLVSSIEELQKSLEQSATRSALQRSIDQLVAEIEINRKAIGELRGVTTPLALEQTPLETLFAQGRQMIESRDYDGAEARFAHLIAQEFKLSESHFYLGTIHYFRQEDNRAISAFKKSAEIDDQARHMPVLLFYTAIALARQGNQGEAKRFFETLIRLYPDHAVTPGARERLKSLG